VDPNKKITVVPNELEAVQALLDRATAGMVGTFFADNIPGVLELLQRTRDSGKYTIRQMKVA
jgi:hypothetical protein